MLCGLTSVSSEQAIVRITSIIITVTISILITMALHHLLRAGHITWPLKSPERQKKMDLRWRGRKAAEEEEQAVDNYNKNNTVQPKTSNGEG